MHNTCVDSNRRGSKIRFKVKLRPGYGFDYMSLSIARGYNPRTLHNPHVIRLVT